MLAKRVPVQAATQPNFQLMHAQVFCLPSRGQSFWITHDGEDLRRPESIVVDAVPVNLVRLGVFDHRQLAALVKQPLVDLLPLEAGQRTCFVPDFLRDGALQSFEEPP